MEYQKIINFLDNTPNSGQKIGLKKMMKHMEHITLKVKLNLKFRC